MTWKKLVAPAFYSLVVLLLTACVAPAARRSPDNQMQEPPLPSQLDLPGEPVVFSPPEHHSFPILRDTSSPQVLVYDLQTDTLQAITDDSSQIWWRPGTATAATAIDGKLTLYDAAAGTWSSSDISGADIGAWSPDGSLFAFGARPSPGPPPLRILDIERQKLFTTPAVGYPVQWSPDGARVLLRWAGGHAVLQLQPEVRLTELPSDNSAQNERWLNPHRLAYLADRNTPVLRIVDVSAGLPATIVEEKVSDVLGTFSRDGERLAVNVRAQNRADAAVSLFGLQPLVQKGTIAHASLGAQLSLEDRWSPDNRRLLVIRDRCLPEERLVTLDVETAVEVTLGSARVYRAVWSPDGSWVAYTETRSLYLVPSDGSTDPQLIFDHVAAPIEPKWSSDSRFVAFSKFVVGYGRCE